jgi:hypothetical protein
MLADDILCNQISMTNVVIDVPEYFFGGDDQLCHLPHRLLHVSSLLCAGTLRSIFTVSKSIDVNLKSLRKKGGSRILLLLWAMVTLEKDLGWLSLWDSSWSI